MQSLGNIVFMFYNTNAGLISLVYFQVLNHENVSNTQLQ